VSFLLISKPTIAYISDIKIEIQLDS